MDGNRDLGLPGLRIAGQHGARNHAVAAIIVDEDEKVLGADVVDAKQRVIEAVADPRHRREETEAQVVWPKLGEEGAHSRLVLG